MPAIFEFMAVKGWEEKEICSKAAVDGQKYDDVVFWTLTCKLKIRVGDM